MKLEVSTMTLRILVTRAVVGMLALFVVACSATKSATLSTGMTPGQAVQAMGEPDLKDNVADPNHSGASVLRYVWLEPGKAAIFGSDERLASIQTVEVTTNTKQQVEQQAHAEAAATSGPPQRFDPIETPLNYIFFPAKAATIYFGAGLSCATGAGCEKPQLPPPSAG
jgi:hypothetical protein